MCIRDSVSTAGQAGMMNGVSPSTTAANSIDATSATSQGSAGACVQDSAAHSVNRDSVSIYSNPDNALEGSNGAVPGVASSAISAATPGAPAQSMSVLGGWGSSVTRSHADMPAKASNGCDSAHRGTMAAAAAGTGTFATGTGVCTPAGGSSAPQSGSIASLKGATSSRTGEQHTTHDSDGLRGIVMLGDGGEPVCLDESRPGDMFMEDPQNSVEAVSYTHLTLPTILLV